MKEKKLSKIGMRNLLTVTFSCKCTDRVSNLSCASLPLPLHRFSFQYLKNWGEGWFNLVFLILPASASGSVNYHFEGQSYDTPLFAFF